MKITEYESEHIILKEIGSRIKQYRISLNITQNDLAVKCDISASTVVRIENGEDSMFSNYIKILTGLGLSQNVDILIPEPQQDSLQDLQNASLKALQIHSTSLRY